MFLELAPLNNFPTTVLTLDFGLGALGCNVFIHLIEC